MELHGYNRRGRGSRIVKGGKRRLVENKMHTLVGTEG